MHAPSSGHHRRSSARRGSRARPTGVLVGAPVRRSSQSGGLVRPTVGPVTTEAASTSSADALAGLDHVPRSQLATLPTPLERGPGLPGGARLWVKRDDLTGLGAGGNKARKLEFLCGEALRAGARSLVTVGAGQSNHCRMTAAAGTVLGLEVHLVLSGDRPARPTGNQLLAELFGAQLHHVGCPPNHWGELEIAREQLTDELDRRRRRAALDPDRRQHADRRARLPRRLSSSSSSSAAIEASTRRRSCSPRPAAVPTPASSPAGPCCGRSARTSRRSWRSAWPRASCSACPTSGRSPSRRWR